MAVAAVSATLDHRILAAIRGLDRKEFRAPAQGWDPDITHVHSAAERGDREKAIGGRRGIVGVDAARGRARHDYRHVQPMVETARGRLGRRFTSARGRRDGPEEIGEVLEVLRPTGSGTGSSPPATPS
jgi:hypothetical protein